MTPVGSWRSYFVYTEYKILLRPIRALSPTSFNCANIPSTTTFSDLDPAANKCSIVLN